MRLGGVESDGFAGGDERGVGDAVVEVAGGDELPELGCGLVEVAVAASSGGGVGAGGEVAAAEDAGEFAAYGGGDVLDAAALFGWERRRRMRRSRVVP